MRARGSARQAGDQRRGLPRSRLSAVVHAHAASANYARSFGAQLNYQNRRLAGWAKTVGGFGRAYKASVKAAYPAFLQFTPYGEMLPNAQSYVDLDRERTDDFGLPLARRHVQLGRERGSAVQRHGALEPGDAGEGRRRNPDRARRSRRPTTSWAAAGWAATRAPSVVNADCRTHDVPNLYVVDGSVFPSASEKNPTHTIMALAARAAEHIADRMRRGDL